MIRSWRKDTRIVEALRERSPDQVSVLFCNRCGNPGYYNDGSTFHCDVCDLYFFVASPDEIDDSTFNDTDNVMVIEDHNTVDDLMWWEYELDEQYRSGGE